MRLGFLIAVLVLAVAAFFIQSQMKNEAFGMSPGTMDQLMSTRAENVYAYVPMY